MTVSHVTIEALKDLTAWYRLTFVSQKNGVGHTKTEFLLSEEALRMIRNQINQAIGEPPDYSNLPENLKNFMEDRK